MNQYLNSVIQKRFAHGNILFYLKAIDFEVGTKLTKAQKNQYSKYLLSLNGLNKYQKRNQSAILISFKEDKNSAIQDIQALLNYISQINQMSYDFLLFLFNVVELEYQYNICTKDEINMLLKKLLQCQSHKTVKIETLLFKYYQFFLYYSLQQYDICNNIGLNTIADINENNLDKDNSVFNNYLKLRMNIIFWKINVSMNEKTEQAETEKRSILQTVYDQIKPRSAYNAAKIGIYLAESLHNNYKYNEAFLLLIELYYNVKKEITLGLTEESPYEIILHILFRLAYISVFLGFEMESKKMAKKLHKNYKLLIQYNQVCLSPLKKSTYGYCLAMMHKIIGNNVFSNDQTIACVNEYILRNQSQEVDIINNYILNRTDEKLEVRFNTQLKISAMYLKDYKTTNPLILAVFIIYNYMSLISKDLVYEDLEKKKAIKYKDTIREYADIILVTAKEIIKDKMNPIFQLVYLRIAFIRAAVCKCYCMFNDNNQNAFLNEISAVEKIKGDLIGTDPLARKEYSFIIKLKGDNAYRNEEYQKAVECYKEALVNLFLPKQKALLYFNLGLAYLFLKDIFLGKRFLNFSLNEYQNMMRINSLAEYQKKIELIDKIINHF